MKSCVFILLLLAFAWCKGFGQCKGLSFEDGVSKGLISFELFNTSINSDFLGCPNNMSGDSSLCGQINYERRVYDIGLPDQLFFTLFLTPRNYKISKTIFNDGFFQQSIHDVPLPSLDAIAWYDKSKNYIVTLLESDLFPPPFGELDSVQKKIVTVLHAVNSWTYCPKEVYGPLGITHATFDKNNNIVIYRTACKTEDVYAANVSETALVHRLFFVCSHELAHVIDKKRGILGVEMRENSERRANVNGLILTLAFAKLFNEMLKENLITYSGSENTCRCDVSYLTAMIKRWTKVEAYLTKKVNAAKDVYFNHRSVTRAFRSSNEWTMWSCMSLTDAEKKFQK